MSDSKEVNAARDKERMAIREQIALVKENNALLGEKERYKERWNNLQLIFRPRDTNYPWAAQVPERHYVCGTTPQDALNKLREALKNV